MIAIGRPVDGLTINGLDWLLDLYGKPIEFNNVPDAQAFLMKCGVAQRDLKHYRFIDPDVFDQFDKAIHEEVI